MKKALIKKELYYFSNHGEKIIDPNNKKTYPPRLKGDVSNIYGFAGGISGDASNIAGDVSDIYGNVTGIYGCVSRFAGNIDDCKITKKDRERGVDIRELIK